MEQENHSMPMEKAITSEETTSIAPKQLASTSPETTTAMEVHKHPVHPTQKKKWSEYLLEFLMIFLAVFLGFIAENLRERIVEKNHAKEFAVALIKDLARDTVAINSQEKNYRTYIRIVDTLVNIYKQGPSSENAGKFKFYSRFMMWAVTLPWNTVTLDQLKSSGGLRYFRNYSLVEKITAYETRQKSIDAEFGIHTQRAQVCLDLINKILEPDYHQEISPVTIATLDTVPQSTIDAFTYKQLAPFDFQKPEVKQLLNMCVVQQRNLLFRVKSGFPVTKQMAIDLIADLKREYNID